MFATPFKLLLTYGHSWLFSWEAGLLPIPLESFDNDLSTELYIG